MSEENKEISLKDIKDGLENTTDPNVHTLPYQFPIPGIYDPYEQKGGPDTLPYEPYKPDDGKPDFKPIDTDPGFIKAPDDNPDFIPIDTDPGFIKAPDDNPNFIPIDTDPGYDPGYKHDTYPDLPEEPGNDHTPSMGEIYAKNHPDPGTAQSLQKALENNNKVLIGGKFYNIPEGMDLQEKFGEPAYPDVETCLKANQTTGKDGEERELYGAELSDELEKYGFMMGPDGAIYQLPDDYEPEDDGFTGASAFDKLSNIDIWEYNEIKKMDDDQKKEYSEKSNHVGYAGYSGLHSDIHAEWDTIPAPGTESSMKPERHISDKAKDYFEKVKEDRFERVKEALGIDTDEPDTSHTLDSEFSDF